ncbi:MAG TPA: ferrochelatase [Candidatus Methylomirabilis sp.]|nr:ferrochelatase [Candidatus Methylomirabilis sp.]
MSEQIAVVLCNLGGPDSLESVRPFLFNLFSDPDIFRLPLGFLTQRPFAALIARRRAPEAAKGYAAIGGKSPILEFTRAQAEALAPGLGDGFDVHVCMRYWHPLTGEVVAMLKSKNYSRVILLPLYPQYSITTSGSSYNEFMRQCERQHYRPAVTLVRQWYDQPDYQGAIVEMVRAEAQKFPDPDPKHIELLFSAHGLPRKIVDQGDPYERQIRATYDALRAHLGWPHTTLCYQSRVGPLEWLRPYTDDVIREKAAAGVKQMLVYPIAFVSDHVETLFELGITYAEIARAQGIAHYRVVPALNSHPRFIEALKSLVLNAVSRHD